MFNIPGGARNLLPLAYERPASKTQSKWSKTGKNREFPQKTAFKTIFTQPRLEHTRRFSVFSPYSAQKFPTKTTGNFLDYIRELQFFILIIITTWAMIILYLQKL